MQSLFVLMREPHVFVAAGRVAALKRGSQGPLLWGL